MGRLRTLVSLRYSTPAVGNQEIVRSPHLSFWEGSHEVLFDDMYVIGIGKSDTLRKPPDMRINSNSLVSSMGMIQNNVGCLPAHTGN